MHSASTVVATEDIETSICLLQTLRTMVDEGQPEKTLNHTEESQKKRKRPSSSNTERPSQKGRKLKQYVLEEKLDIIDYAKVIGNRAAGREFNVAESSIREWRKNEQRLRSMFETAPERSRLDGGGRRPVSDDLEKSLLLYVASTADAESPLTWHAIKEKANDIWNEICERDAEFKEKDFVANMGWVARFVRRNNIKVATSYSTSSPSESSNGICCPPVVGVVSTSESVSSPQKPVALAEEKCRTAEPPAISPKRRRKNFTPKKLVEHSSVSDHNILLEEIAEHKVDNTAQSRDDVINSTDADDREEDEDENIDVCF